MPCDQHIFIDNNIDVLSEIYHYCLSYNVQYLVIGGDLNTDISRINSANTITLNILFLMNVYNWQYNLICPQSLIRL